MEDKYLGKRLEGRYDIIELVGSGGMANVYRAYDIIDDIQVAVKILRDEYSSNSEFIRRFKNESKAIALLNHPNIVRVFDVSFTNSIHSIVMEYIDGVSLKEFIQHKGPLPTREALHFTKQILNALQHAHDKGIVHRDIKPQNIMLLRNGQIKVTDFGIARFARSEARTITDRAIGSVHYISPEQAMGENTDERSDVYSVGVMIYEMLTATLPFEADTAVSVALKQIQAPVKKPTEINPNIPVGIEDITLHAMEKNANERYQSSAEMLADIKKYEENPNVRVGKATSNQKIKSNTKKKGKPVQAKSSVPYLKVMAIMTTAVCVATAGFVGLMFYLNNPFAKTEEIPSLYDMVGQKFSDVQKKHYPINLIVEETFDNEVPNGVVMEQKPKAGTKIKENGSVRVTVSKGRQEIIIPDVVGVPSNQAMNQLRDLGLVVTESSNREFDDNVPAGSILFISPAPGTKVGSGETVELTVSNGEKKIPISIPNVTGMNEASARAVIADSKFSIGSVTKQKSEFPAGTIISQNPPPGSLETEGTQISIIVSEGGLNSWSISIPLPNGMDRDVLIRARVGPEAETVISEETLNPATSTSNSWSATFTGESAETIVVSFYVDKSLYQRYNLDLETGEAWITDDYSNSEKFSS